MQGARNPPPPPHLPEVNCSFLIQLGPVPERSNNSIPGINVPYFRDDFIPGINCVPKRRNSAIQEINQGPVPERRNTLYQV